jgi:GTPase SAR1 family protein
LLVSLSATISERLFLVILVGNKSDIEKQEVAIQESYLLASKLKYNFVKISAKSCINIRKAFYNLVQYIQYQGDPPTEDLNKKYTIL